MVLFNYALKELTAKIVYYGPGLSGKTTNLQYVYDELPIKNKGRMLTLATETDRTLYFDFLPVDAGVVRGIKTRVQLYTVPGQVFYNATRRMVLKGADGIVFVADSQRHMMEANLESWDNLRENLGAHDLDLEQVPLVLQLNKRDLEGISTVEEMNDKLNGMNRPFYEAVAKDGIGVEDTLQGISGLVLKTVIERYGGEKKMTPLGKGVNDPASTAPDSATTEPEPLFAGGAAALASSEAGAAGGAPASRKGRATATTWPSVQEDASGSAIEGAGQAFEDVNIDGILDEVLGLEKESDADAPEAPPGPGPVAAVPPPTEVSVSRPEDGSDDAFSGLLDDSLGAEEVESILDEPASVDDAEPDIEVEVELGGDDPEPVAESLDEASAFPASPPASPVAEAPPPEGKAGKLIEVPVWLTLDDDEELEDIELLLKIRFERKKRPR